MGEFSRAIGSSGGDMELPFALKFPSLGETMPAQDIPVARGVEGSAHEGEPVWRLPVMSASLRTGQMVDDGSHAPHEYTTQYLKIFEAACDYRYAQARLNGDYGPLSENQRATSQAKLNRSVRMAQAAFTTITSGVIDRQLSGRHNIFAAQHLQGRCYECSTAELSDSSVVC